MSQHHQADDNFEGGEEHGEGMDHYYRHLCHGVGTSEALYLVFDGHISWYDKALKRKML